MAERTQSESPCGKVSTGVAGLDHLLRGGLVRDALHLVKGSTGTGKTTLALQFLLAGVREGEQGLFVTMSQTEAGLRAMAESHGWSLDGVVVSELLPGEASAPEAVQTVLHSAEVELAELVQGVRDAVERAGARRLVFDSVGVLAMLAGNPTRYRREIVGLRSFLARRGCTALFVGESPLAEPEDLAPSSADFQMLSTSVVQLEQLSPGYGEVRRRLRICKVRGGAFEGGYHDFRICAGGLQVYTRLDVSERPDVQTFESVRSGLPVLDDLLGGGLERGTACLFIGPPGTGKSTLGSAFLRSAAQQGTPAALFLFDERPETFRRRSAGVGLDLDPVIDQGLLTVTRLITADISPGDFAHQVREAVEQRGVRVVAIDSLTGYFNAMADTSMLPVHMHELLGYLSSRDVLTILVVAQEGFMTVGAANTVDVSYLSDSIVVFRQFEADGHVRRCIAAVKKRQGEHETTIRELSIGPGFVRIGPPIVSADPLLDTRLG
jgi:circadian clock protein KaiC